MATTRTPADACTLIDNDHKAVKKMFTAHEELTKSRARGTDKKKRELAREICQELTAHATIEEETFYPALRKALKETDLLAEAAKVPTRATAMKFLSSAIIHKE